MVDRDRRFPAASFAEKVRVIRSICDGFRQNGLFDEVIYIDSNSTDLIKLISKKYLANLTGPHETHEIGGTALISYLVGLEATKTRHVVHYDADMLLHQSGDTDWVCEGERILDRESRILNVIPRRSPPFDIKGLADGPSMHAGRPFTEVAEGWVDDWFSTRCFMFDRTKVNKLLPLLSGKFYWKALFSKWVGRRFPRSPEILFFHKFAAFGFRTFICNSTDVWTLHPADKGEKFQSLLAEILPMVARGQFPIEQAGKEDVDLEAWCELIKMRHRRQT